MGHLDLHKLLKRPLRLSSAPQLSGKAHEDSNHTIVITIVHRHLPWWWSCEQGKKKSLYLPFWHSLAAHFDNGALAREVHVDSTNGYAAVFLWQMQGLSVSSGSNVATISHVKAQTTCLFMLYK